MMGPAQCVAQHLVHFSVPQNIAPQAFSSLVPVAKVGFQFLFLFVNVAKVCSDGRIFGKRDCTFNADNSIVLIFRNEKE